MVRTNVFPGRQVAINQAAYRTGDFVRAYANRSLAPVEVLLMVRYREVLSGRTLELGCGAGRVLGYLAQLGVEANGVDLSRRMVDYCAATYPRAHVRVGDINHPETCGSGRFDAIWATNNILDVLDDANRRRVLAGLAGMIESNGVLIFSSHNLDAVARRPGAASDSHPDHRPSEVLLDALRRLASKPPAAVLRRLAAAPARRRNRRRLEPLTYFGDGYAVLNDEAHDYGLLHYYIGRDDQERQLAEVGYGLIECLDIAGDVVPPGTASRSPELHYVSYPR
jgi:SAM-dependent methyltransferase